MGFDPRGAKRPVDMSLNADLVRKARSLSPNLSETVERLLADFVAAEEARRAEIDRHTDQWASASRALVTRYGSPADEHLPF